MTPLGVEMDMLSARVGFQAGGEKALPADESRPVITGRHVQGLGEGGLVSRGQGLRRDETETACDTSPPAPPIPRGSSMAPPFPAPADAEIVSVCVMDTEGQRLFVPVPGVRT